MYRLILTFSLLVFGLSSTVLAQQVSEDFAALITPEMDAGIAEAAGTESVTASFTTNTRLANLRTLVPRTEGLLVRQLSTQLRTRNVAERTKTLQDIIMYAGHYGDLVDFSSLSAGLLRVFVSDPDPAHRIMAAHAIALIGDTDANVQLIEAARQDRSPRVRRVAMLAAVSVVNGGSDH
jgi:hypothetical protein